MSKARGGRPSKLTPEVQEKIVTAIRAGNYAQVAAVYAGITERTYYRWMELGDQARGGRYLQFFQAVKAAEGEAEVRAVAIIQKKMTGDWRAAMAYLERKHPKRWGRRVDVTSGDEPLKPIPVEIQSAEEAREALRAMGVEVEV
jgi:hypothetical protein